MARFLLVLPLFLASLLIAQTKQTDAAPTRDAKAVDVLQRSANALGVPQLLLKQSSAASGQFVPASDSTAKPTDFVWKCLGSDCRMESMDQSGQSSVLVSGSTSAAQVAGRQVPVGRHVSMAQVRPFLFGIALQGRLQDQKYSITYDGQKPINGVLVDVVTISLLQHGVPLEFMTQRWFVDANTSLPLRVEYQIPDFADANWLVPAAFEFSNYTTQSGVVMPTRVTHIENGKVIGTSVLKSVAFDVSLSITEITSVGGAQ